MRCLLIKQCRNPFAWYKHCIGQYVPYFGTDPQGWKTTRSIIPFDDAALVDIDYPEPLTY